MDIREIPFQWHIRRNPLSWQADGIRSVRFLLTANHAMLTADRQREIQSELDRILARMQKGK